MRHDPPTQPTIIRALGDGLILRRSTAADAEPLADFMAEAFRDPITQRLDPLAATWVRDLLRGDHPTFGLGDFTIVEETQTGRIVSAMCLIAQTWSYAGITLSVGRPELVATHIDYRRRGLVRAQFEEIHRWSQQRGDDLLAIIGIPWYYRQFGYEMGLELHGGRTGYLGTVPQLADGASEPFVLRPATAADLPLFGATIEQGSARYLVAAQRDTPLWRYELEGRAPDHLLRRELRVIESAAGAPVGVLVHPPLLWGAALVIKAYELQPGVSWAAVTPSVLRYIVATGNAYAAQRQSGPPFSEYSFGLGSAHPVYEVLGERLPHHYQPNAWYVRVPDIGAFLRRIAPVLEQRLAASLLAGHTGELRLNFYRSGLRLALEQGRITTIEPWQPQRRRDSAAFPELTFLQLLFGYRSLAELRYAFADCSSESESQLLLDVLFPRRPSYVWAIG